MKPTIFMMFIILVLMIFLFIIGDINDTYYNKIEQQDNKIDSLENVIKVKDSIFQYHLKNCSFISKSQLDTNKYGDVFVLDSKDLTFNLMK